jgi:cellulose synthase/poly-beta-1,6-N-acetylglucosamine synthase-like glycosyltransferase
MNSHTCKEMRGFAGEDRWLCTLLLQQGYRVEYCAASDSYTFAPEGFYEFYNQRRRWTPSTMANIIDLLGDWQHTTKQNQVSQIKGKFRRPIFCLHLCSVGCQYVS